MGIKIGRIVMGSVQTNCYFLYREGGADCIFVDAADNGRALYEQMQKYGFTVKAILLTHAHFDHIWGLEELKELTGAPVYTCEKERPVCGDPYMNISAQAGRKCTVQPDFYVKDGESITAAGMTCRLIWTPGHTIGSCCYYFEESGFLLSGDTLFQGSVGRTDFPGGSMSELVNAVRDKLLVLPDAVKVYPGHGEATTIGEEKQYNPFLQ